MKTRHFSTLVIPLVLTFAVVGAQAQDPKPNPSPTPGPTMAAEKLRLIKELLELANAKGTVDAIIKAQSELMRAVTKGVVHKNTGSRKVSRLAAQLKKLSAA